MSLRAKLNDPALPLILYEIIPPRLDDPSELEDRLRVAREVAGLVDAINVPEIREEVARGPRTTNLPSRMKPMEFARAIRERVNLETAVNRVTVHESAEDQRRWLEEASARFGV